MKEEEMATLPPSLFAHLIASFVWALPFIKRQSVFTSCE